VVIRRELVFALLENICDEMARQGLKKIILLSGHGGNRHMLPLFVQTLMETPHDYCVYFANLPHFTKAEEILDTREIGHACEAETSTMLHTHPELVKMEALPDEDSPSLARNQALKDVDAYSPVDWYAMYPRMYVGDARSATAGKGKVMMDDYRQRLVRLIRAVKQDTISPEMMKDFQSAATSPPSPWEK
jgi:creatinine amidohydrolase